LEEADLTAAVHDLGGIWAKSLFLGDLFEFLWEVAGAKSGRPDLSLEREVRLRGVRFTYRGARRSAARPLDVPRAAWSRSSVRTRRARSRS
jgi:hypothetical protein